MLVTYLLLSQIKRQRIVRAHRILCFELVGRISGAGALLMRMPSGKSFKLLLAAFCVSPLFVQQSFAVSSDVVCNCFCISLMTIWATWTELRVIDLACLAVFGLLGCITKPIYVSIAATVFCFAGVDYQSGPRLRRNTGTSAASYGLLVFFVLMMGAALFNSQHALSHYPANASPAPAGVDVVQQCAWIKLHPHAAFQIVNEDFWYIITYPAGFVSPLGWLNLSLSHRTIAFVVFLFLCAAAVEFAYGVANQAHRGHVLKRFVGASILFIGGYVFGFLYALGNLIFWTPIGAAHSRGLQPRNLFGTFLLWTLAAYTLFINAGTSKKTINNEKMSVLDKSAAGLVSVVFLLYLGSLTGNVMSRYWSN